MKKTQREAVYAATMNVLGEAEVHFEEGGDITEVMTDTLRSQVSAIVCEGFTADEVQLSDTPANAEKLANPPKLKVYVSGLISNWYRKDPRFNGNTKYTPKNPGSRAGQGDQQLKALKQLHKQFVGEDDTKAELIQAQIDIRVKAIQVEKAKTIQADLSALPAELLESLGLSFEESDEE